MAQHSEQQLQTYVFSCVFDLVLSLYLQVCFVCFVDLIFMNRYQGMVQREVILGSMERLESSLVSYSSLSLLCFVCRLGRRRCELCYGCRQMVFVL